MPKLIPASALILYRYRDAQLQLLTVQRSARLRAFPSAWTFPGGRLDTEDALLQGEDLALQVCALREVFEELGILPGYTGPLDDWQTWRQQLHQGEVSFETLLQRLDFQPDLTPLIPIRHRVTPDFAPRRFDTAYFLLEENRDWPLDALSPELAEACWVSPADMMQRWYRGNIIIPPPVRDVFKVLQAGVLDEAHLAALRDAANEDGEYPMPETHPGIHLLPLRSPTLPPARHTNCYLVGTATCLIVDPASSYTDEQEKLAQVVGERLAQGDQMQIVLTHHHPDHIGGVLDLKRRFGLSVYAHAQTAAQVDFDVEYIIDDGYCWDLGADPYTGVPWQVQALHTPGHASGHLCLLDMRHRVAIVGDMLAGIGTILIELPDGNMQAYLDSLQRLADLDLTFLFPSHGPVIHQPQARCVEYIEHRLMRENNVLGALKSEAVDMDTLLPRVYPELDVKLYPLARRSLLAHLDKLLDEKRIENKGGFYQLRPFSK